MNGDVRYAGGGLGDAERGRWSESEQNKKYGLSHKGQSVFWSE